MQDLSPLFSPFQIRDVKLPNRFVMPSMQRGFAKDGVPTPEMAQYYRKRAENGISLVFGEGTAVDHPSATDYTDFALLTRPALEGWKRVIDEVKEANGNIFLQLWHQGGVREEGKGLYPEAPTLSPSGLALPGVANGRAMTRRDLAEVRDAFVSGAEVAKSLGFDGVEVHSAHGYLLDQFIWGSTNVRDDEYGGSLANRARFPCEVVSGIRTVVGPDYPISVRISQWKTRAWDAVNFESSEELKLVLEMLVRAGADLFHASTRRFWEPEFSGSDLGFAGWVKRLSGKSVIAVGSVGLDVDVMASLGGVEAGATELRWLEELVRRFSKDEFDLVAVGRAVLSDAEWVIKIRDGSFESLKPFNKEVLAFLD
jgi:2,4-dienoyl-CoA reductase-like NADH-dependent reductase (Old Yellow Enzyme family)